MFQLHLEIPTKIKASLCWAVHNETMLALWSSQLNKGGEGKQKHREVQ